MRRLIVTADDLGLTAGVNDAVRRAHTDGIVTATSLLPVGQAYEHAVAMLRDLPGLAVGAHLAIVGEDPPLLSAREVPTLVDRTGRFPATYQTVVGRGLTGRLDADDVRRELSAQLQRLTSSGLQLSHVDTHQHTHLWPAVGAVVCQLAAEHQIPAVRVPQSRRLHPISAGVSALSSWLRRTARRSGRYSTAAYAGLDEAGNLDRRAFSRALDRVPSRATSVEINTHPGTAGDEDLHRFDWGFRWADELAMLTDPAVRDRIAAAGFTLSTFADLRH